MNAIALSCITFVCISGGALLGMFLPGHHLSTDDKDVVRLGTGLIGTIAALVLGLLIASAKGSYDTQSTQVTRMTSNVVLLDNLLAQYGPEANDVRNLLRRGIVVLADRMWREKSSEVANANPFEASAASEAFFAKLQQLRRRTIPSAPCKPGSCRSPPTLRKPACCCSHRRTTQSLCRSWWC